MFLKNADGRLWELDFLRGIAIILMIIFHFIYDLNHYSVVQYVLWKGPFAITASIIASIFVILLGISLTISYQKKMTTIPPSSIYKNYVKRGLKIFSLGLVITLISWIIIPERFVIFGILHCIGICIIISIPFLKYIKLNLLLGSILITTGLYLRILEFDFSWLIPLGFLPSNYFTIDYFPLLPWFGVVLIGISLGNYFYPHAQRRYHFNDLSAKKIPQRICFIGRHSLHIYFIHQPILVGLIFIFMMLV